MKVKTEQKQVTYKVTPTDYWWVSQKKKIFFKFIYLFIFPFLFFSFTPLCWGLPFNSPQWGSCSARYETPTHKQVVYKWCSTMFPKNVRCVTGEGAATFQAAPHVPGGRAVHTGPQSRRVAGCNTPLPERCGPQQKSLKERRKWDDILKIL